MVVVTWSISSEIFNDTIRYDTMYLRALESWRYGHLSLAHGTETENEEKLKTKTE